MSLLNKDKETKEEKEAREATEAERQRELEENNPEFYRLFKTDILKSEGETEMKLYRVIRRGKKRIKEFVSEYHCEVPSETQIGENFGGGLFWAIGWDEDDNKYMTYIRISEHYTKLKEKREREQAMMVPQQQKDPLESITAYMAAMKPIMELFKGNNKNQGSSDVERVLNTVIESYSKGMVKLQQAFVTEKLEHIKELNKKPRVIPPEKLNWVKEVLQFAKPFINNFLSSNGKIQEMLKKSLLDNTSFQKIKDDDMLFKLLYTYMCQDGEIGEEKANQLFEKAGFEIPTEEEESTETEQESTEEGAEKEPVATGND